MQPIGYSRGIVTPFYQYRPLFQVYQHTNAPGLRQYPCVQNFPQHPSNVQVHPLPTALPSKPFTTNSGQSQPLSQTPHSFSQQSKPPILRTPANVFISKTKNKNTAWACENCHYPISEKTAQTISKDTLEQYKSSFLYLWVVRLARKGGRDLVGCTLDKAIPLPHLQAHLKKRFKSWENFYARNCMEYPTAFQRLIKRQPITFPEFFRKTIVNMRIWSIYGRFYRGTFFWGMARTALMLFTVYDVGKYAYRAYKYPQEREKNLKLCLKQAIKWTIGTEIGNIGADIGAFIAPSTPYQELIAFLMGSLWSAMFDKLLHRFFDNAA